jgi:hypothetical protein
LLEVLNLLFIPSIVFGVISIVKASIRLNSEVDDFNKEDYASLSAQDLAILHTLDSATFFWLPDLSFSCAMDAITTSMIAWRLGHIHFGRLFTFCIALTTSSR